MTILNIHRVHMFCHSFFSFIRFRYSFCRVSCPSHSLPDLIDGASLSPAGSSHDSLKSQRIFLFRSSSSQQQQPSPFILPALLTHCCSLFSPSPCHFFLSPYPAGSADGSLAYSVNPPLPALSPHNNSHPLHSS